MENLYTPNCIRTVSGIYVNVFDPKPEMFRIEDIAHSLSNQCRFGGHLPVFYCVAQHSLNCSYLVDNPKLKLAALLHDASEAYLLDIPKPIKSGLANYKEIEDRLMMCIAERFEFDYPLCKEIKKADEIMLQLEWDALMLGRTGYNLSTHHPHDVRDNFLKAFKYYTHLLKGEPVAEPILVGDVVKVIAKVDHYKLTGEVVSIKEGARHPYKVEFDDGDIYSCYSEKELQKCPIKLLNDERTASQQTIINEPTA